jgi:hypothetical protein
VQHRFRPSFKGRGAVSRKRRWCSPGNEIRPPPSLWWNDIGKPWVPRNNTAYSIISTFQLKCFAIEPRCPWPSSPATHHSYGFFLSYLRARMSREILKYSFRFVISSARDRFLRAVRSAMVWTVLSKWGLYFAGVPRRKPIFLLYLLHLCSHVGDIGIMAFASCPQECEVFLVEKLGRWICVSSAQHVEAELITIGRWSRDQGIRFASNVSTLGFHQSQSDLLHSFKSQLSLSSTFAGYRGL